MKLSDLAKKAATLPRGIEFEWGGPEQWHQDVFAREVTTLPQAIEYIDKLRERMASYAHALHDLSGAYRQLRDLILEAEVSGGQEQ